MENQIRHGTYIGPLALLKGKTALLRRSGSVHVTAQFDELHGLPHSITHGWTPFKASDFSIDRDMSKIWKVIQKRDALRAAQLMCDAMCRHSGKPLDVPVHRRWSDAEEEAAQNHWPTPGIRENY